MKSKFIMWKLEAVSKIPSNQIYPVQWLMKNYVKEPYFDEKLLFHVLLNRYLFDLTKNSLFGKDGKITGNKHILTKAIIESVRYLI